MAKRKSKRHKAGSRKEERGLRRGGRHMGRKGTRGKKRGGHRKARR